MEEINRRKTFLKRNGTAILRSTRECGEEGRGVGGLREDDLEELGGAVSTFIWFPELRTES